MSAKKLQIVMPMAGLGSRFAKAGFELPKPLIPVDGLPMFQKSLSSLDGIEAPKTFTFVIRREQIENQHLDQRIKSYMPEAQIIILGELTRGAAETVLMGTEKLEPKFPLISLDCDLWFSSREYNTMIQNVLTSGSSIDGGVLTFPSDNPRYSYAEVNERGNVIRTAEKIAISSRAITGAYFFAKTEYFINATRQLLQQPLNQSMPEFYISSVYNILIADGKNIKATNIDKFASFGTPEELAAYEKK